MTAIREALETLDAICQDSLETTLAQVVKGREWHQTQEVSALFLRLHDIIEALEAVAEAAREHIDAMASHYDNVTADAWWPQLAEALARLAAVQDGQTPHEDPDVTPDDLTADDDPERRAFVRRTMEAHGHDMSGMDWKPCPCRVHGDPDGDCGEECG